MASNSYGENYKDPRWQQFRLKVFERDGFKCTMCESPSKQLHAHHVYYIASRKPWQYPIECVRTLCEDCHKAEHLSMLEDSKSGEWKEWEYLIAMSNRSLFGHSIGVGIIEYAMFCERAGPGEIVDAIVWGLAQRDCAIEDMLNRYRESRPWFNNQSLYQ